MMTATFLNVAPIINLKFLDKSNSTAMNDFLIFPIRPPVEINHENMWFFWAYQSFLTYSAALQAVGHGCLLVGLLDLLCAQFDILSHRLKLLSVSQTNKVIDSEIQKTIDHHAELYR